MQPCSILSAEAFRADLIAYRELVEPLANHGTFLLEGIEHTWLRNAGFYSASTGGVTLMEWLKKIADGAAPGHPGTDSAPPASR